MIRTHVIGKHEDEEIQISFAAPFINSLMKLVNSIAFDVLVHETDDAGDADLDGATRVMSDGPFLVILSQQVVKGQMGSVTSSLGDFGVEMIPRVETCERVDQIGHGDIEWLDFFGLGSQVLSVDEDGSQEQLSQSGQEILWCMMVNGVLEELTGDQTSAGANDFNASRIGRILIQLFVGVMIEQADDWSLVEHIHGSRDLVMIDQEEKQLVLGDELLQLGKVFSEEEKLVINLGEGQNVLDIGSEQEVGLGDVDKGKHDLGLVGIKTGQEQGRCQGRDNGIEVSRLVSGDKDDRSIGIIAETWTNGGEERVHGGDGRMSGERGVLLLPQPMRW